MTDTDYAVITLTDHRGRTVCKFIKEKPDTGWIVSDFQGSRKAMRHTPTERDIPPHRLVRLPDGRRVLELPGLTLRWEKVPPILDRLTDHAITRITVPQLRDCVR